MFKAQQHIGTLDLGALAGRVWRIGLMGRNARPDAVLLVLAARSLIRSRKDWRSKLAQVEEGS